MLILTIFSFYVFGPMRQQTMYLRGFLGTLPHVVGQTILSDICKANAAVEVKVDR